MVVKSQIKFIKSLQQKKYRNQHGKFVVEGIKVVKELMASHINAEVVYSTDVEFVEKHKDVAELISEADLKKISSLHTPNKVVGIFNIPTPQQIDTADWTVALDDVRDPGNLGTIIRLCDWFGIKTLLCSHNTVDCYNPKVLQATMGSISRVNIMYADLKTYFEGSAVPIFGAFMDGDVVYKEPMPKFGILVMGNEANGISNEIEALVTRKVSIPQFGSKTAESLNVATATAILLNEIKRSE
ncbi:TrmH family RNA methyltransferase [Saonia flava]|uniref:TrmH family RNA methyltransferase n=1 Tax=Saonia flava TaxID=523696 RepID=A0A846R1R2_9FLAO|nr:RNA methyltransferase [Saonia flava]NJB70779.1 TrmH family RNA methyltransferase [Saonia flava]